MKKIAFALLFFVIVFGNSYAQKRELGNVTVDELKEKVHPKDSSAVAAVLFEKGRSYFEYNQEEGFRVITEVEVKLKIYKKEGYDWANRTVSFYIGGGVSESVSFAKAVTYNLENNQIVKSKLKSDGEFVEKVNKFWSRKKISMPNVKEGSIVEYKYTIRSPYISTLPEWNFQYSIPVSYSEYETLIPEYYIYNTYRKGALQLIETKDAINKTVMIVDKERSMQSIRSGAQSGIKSTTSEFRYIENKTKFVLENVPALKDESFVNNIDNYRSSVQHELSEKRLPQAIAEFYSTTWEDVTKKIYESEDFGDQLNKDNYFEGDVKTLLQGLTTAEKKIATIFSFVQSRMNWNKYNSYSCDDGVKKAYQDKTGNSAEINLMLVSMLRYAQLDANPVLVSTRANGISLFPSRTAYNFVIAAVNINENLILLDATSKIALPNILPVRDLNWFGRIIRKDGTSDLVDLMPKTLSYDVVNMLVTMDDKGQISGKVREQYLDHSALRFRDNLGGLTKDAIAEKIEKQFKGIEIADYELSNSNISEPVVEKYAVTSSNVSEIIGDKIYFSPMLYLATTENPFKQETREYPVDFSYPFRDKYMINITIPDGYTVESTPKSIAIAMDMKYGAFNYTVTVMNSQIQLSAVLDINTSIIAPDDYNTLKEFFKVVVEKQNEKIVLKKI